MYISQTYVCIKFSNNSHLGKNISNPLLYEQQLSVLAWWNLLTGTIITILCKKKMFIWSPFFLIIFDMSSDTIMTRGKYFNQLIKLYEKMLSILKVEEVWKLFILFTTYDNTTDVVVTGGQIWQCSGTSVKVKKYVPRMCLDLLQVWLVWYKRDPHNYLFSIATCSPLKFNPHVKGTVIASLRIIFKHLYNGYNTIFSISINAE